MSTSTWITLGVLVLLVLYVIAIYNHLVALRNRFKNAFAQIDVQLRRRYDLIPNLVETAKGYMKHERETLEAVIQARARAANANSKAAANPDNPAAIQALIGAEAALGSTMGQFFGLMENYPDLKANATMSQLMEELTSTENKVSFARQAFNDSVMVYNTAREQFPSSLVANNFGFKEAEFFLIQDPQQRETVRIAF